MKCNVLMTNFVKKTLKNSHVTLVERLMEKAHVIEAREHNERLKQTAISPLELPGSPSFQSVIPPSPEMRSTRSISPYLSERQSYQSLDSHQSPIASPPYWNMDPSYQIANPYKSEESNSYPPTLEQHPAKRGGTSPYQSQRPWGKVANAPPHDIYPIHSPVEMEGWWGSLSVLNLVSSALRSNAFPFPFFIRIYILCRHTF